MDLKACNGKIITDKDGYKLDKCYNGTYYENFFQYKSKNGFIEEYWTGEHCYNSLV